MILANQHTEEIKIESVGKSIRFDQIDVLRGLAALMVVFHHCCIQAHGEAWWHISIFGNVFYPSHIFNYGYVGVDLFLVLSGFCLSWPILTRSDKQFRLGVYAKRRFQRIYPPYLIAFLMLLFAGFICRASGIPRFQRLEFAQSLSILRILGSLSLQTTNLNSAFWTLCLEARWYLIFPLVVITARKYSMWPLLAITVIISYLTPYTEHGPVKLLIYLPAFVSGVLAVQIHAASIRSKNLTNQDRQRWFYTAGLIVFLLICITWLPNTYFYKRGTIGEVFPTSGLFLCLLLLVLSHESALSMPFRLLRNVGIFSYSLYLIHIPIIELGQAIYQPSHFTHTVQLFYWQCIFVPITVILSYLFFLVAEKPFISGSPSGNLALRWWKKPSVSLQEAVISKETV